MTIEVELKDFPVEGLRGYWRHKGTRDISMNNYQKLGFECQPWKVNKWGFSYYGFSYSKTRRISKKQLAEFVRLQKKYEDTELAERAYDKTLEKEMGKKLAKELGNGKSD